jgi:hypothetical protein
MTAEVEALERRKRLAEQVLATVDLPVCRAVAHALTLAGSPLSGLGQAFDYQCDALRSGEAHSALATLRMAHALRRIEAFHPDAFDRLTGGVPACAPWIELRSALLEQRAARSGDRAQPGRSVV